MNRSHWLQEHFAGQGPEAARAAPLEGDARCDVAIVGGGYVGLWTALRLKELEPALDIAVVERDICGGGASGRNSGFVLSWWAKFLSLKKICGTEEALRLCRASAEAVAAIGRFCAASGIEAHFRQDGWLWAATCPAHAQAWRETLEALDRHQTHPFRELAPGEAARLAGSPAHIAGVLEAGCGSVQPAHLVRGLARLAQERGVRIYEGSPMRALELGPTPTLRTPRGRLAAGCVILAMNAWAAIFPEIFRAIAIISAEHIVTAPMPERLATIGWSGGMTVSDCRMLVRAYRTTRDGRLAFASGGVSGVQAYGGRVGGHFDGPSRRAQALERALRETYPMLADVPVTASWGGPVDRTKSGLPVFGPLRRPDVLFAVGFSGNGVGPSYLAGKILASLALGRRDEWSQCGLVRPLGRDFPPEPLRYLGTALVRRAAAAKDRADHAGKGVGPLVSRLVALAPAGFAPTQRKGGS